MPVVGIIPDSLPRVNRVAPISNHMHDTGEAGGIPESPEGRELSAGTNGASELTGAQEERKGRERNTASRCIKRTETIS